MVDVSCGSTGGGVFGFGRYFGSRIPSCREFPCVSPTCPTSINSSARASPIHPKISNSGRYMCVHTHHRKKPPNRVCRLRADTNPVLCAVDIEPDVLVQFPRRIVRVLLGYRVVRANHLERSAVPCRPEKKGEKEKISICTSRARLFFFSPFCLLELGWTYFAWATTML